MNFNKCEVIKQFRTDSNDTGSSTVQIAIFTKLIENLTRHLKEFEKDFAARMGLMKIISKRRRLLNYLKRTDQKKCETLAKILGIKINKT